MARATAAPQAKRMGSLAIRHTPGAQRAKGSQINRPAREAERDDAATDGATGQAGKESQDARTRRRHVTALHHAPADKNACGGLDMHLA
eukprot:7981573-Alexandrium_andersonii.AAC.1